jgi:hypothetical protein
MPSKKKRPTKSREPKKKDVRGYIARSLVPDENGEYAEQGHLEGEDALSAVPPETLRLMRRALESGQAKITITEVKRRRK